MDFSAILVLPYAVLLCFSVRLIAALAKLRAPRLIWPFAVCVVTSLPVFYRLPGSMGELGIWMLLAFGLSIYAAIGTLIGASLARFAVGVVRMFRGLPY